MHTFFIYLYSLISKRKTIAVLANVLLVLFLGFFVSKLHFEEDITRIIPKNEKSDVTTKVLQQLNFL